MLTYFFFQVSEDYLNMYLLIDQNYLASSYHTIIGIKSCPPPPKMESSWHILTQIFTVSMFEVTYG